MKYYTKEWYELLQAWGLSGDLKKFRMRYIQLPILKNCIRKS